MKQNINIRPKVAIYCLDQNHDTTSSIGIYNYTKRLISAIALQNDPGFEVYLFLSSANSSNLKPQSLPSWMRVKEIKGCYSSGIRRIWADHILSAFLAKRENVDLIHFPKGWVTILPIKQKIIATLHDTIVQYYKTQYPSEIPYLKILYFDWLAKHSLRVSNRVITVSNSSRENLSKLYPSVLNKISVVYQGTGIQLQGLVNHRKNGNFILVLGSRQRHKATAETLSLLNQYIKNRNLKISVVVTGLSQWPSEWDQSPQYIDIDFVGKVSDKELSRLMLESRALVFLSEIEGFGLPAIEAYAANTAVCFRDSSSLAEILKGVPGGWSGGNEESFFASMDNVLNLSDSEIFAISKRLMAKFNWDKAAKETLNVYSNTLNNN